MIIDESAKMNRMVRQLLTLNQLEFGNDRLSMERFDLAELIRGVLQSSHILIEQKEAKILFQQKDPVPVWGDEFKIEEVVTNYLTNALNHLEGEKVIEITCRDGTARSPPRCSTPDSPFRRKIWTRSGRSSIKWTRPEPGSTGEAASVCLL